MKEANQRLLKLMPEILSVLQSPKGQQLRADHPELQEAYAKMILGVAKIKRFTESLQGGNNVDA